MKHRSKSPKNVLVEIDVKIIKHDVSAITISSYADLLRAYDALGLRVA